MTTTVNGRSRKGAAAAAAAAAEESGSYDTAYLFVKRAYFLYFLFPHTNSATTDTMEQEKGRDGGQRLERLPQWQCR
jgi:hypothetical protein